jgi:hypothetical protein
MTERWRKKLEGIDRVGPSDDLYRRAKDGPTLPEPQSPMQRTSTRVVTAIAAFVVFALGISVFAIPALRLGGNDRFVSAGNQIQPLWPWNSIDAVQTWRDDPQPIGTTSVDHFSSAEDVATGFGRDVLGWGTASVREQGASSDVCPPASLDPAGTCSVGLASGSSPPPLLPYAPTTAAPAFRTFQLFPCQLSMMASCESSLGVTPQITVAVFQPLGDGGPWAVLEARTDLISISLAPGTELRDGSTVYASGVVPGGTRAVLGFNAASEGCGGTGSITGFEETPKDAGTDQQHGISLGTYSRGQLQIGLTPVDTSCEHRSGYLFVAITEKDLGTGDPVGGIRSDVGIIGFAAVPVSFDFPLTGASSGPPSGSSSTEIGWTTYTDPLGWTLDVPATWKAQEETNPRVRFLGDGLAVEISPFSASDTDDSSFPLDPTTFLTQGEGGLVGNFQGDGSPYGFVVFKEDGGFISQDELSDGQSAILDRMIASIAFPSSKLGEGQNGWTAIAPMLRSASAEWIIDKLTGDHYLASLTNNGARVLFGPAPACNGVSGSYEVRETGAAGVVCPDGTGGDWDFTTGQPKPGSSAGFDVALIAHDAVRSWDGWLLARLGPTPSPTG